MVTLTFLVTEILRPRSLLCPGAEIHVPHHAFAEHDPYLMHEGGAFGEQRACDARDVADLIEDVSRLARRQLAVDRPELDNEAIVPGPFRLVHSPGKVLGEIVGIFRKRLTALACRLALAYKRLLWSGPANSAAVAAASATSRRLYVSIRQLTIPQNGKDASAVRRLYTANQTVSFQANDWCKGESDFNSKRLDFNPTFVKFNSEVVHFNSKCKVRTQN